jgi:phosphoglycerol transferase
MDHEAAVGLQPSHSRKRAIAEYGVAAGLSLLAAVFVLRLWNADLRIPFDYRGDSLAFAQLVKSIVDHGWYLTNPSLGAPGVLEMHDFPFAETFHLALIKAMSLLGWNWAVLFNGYFLLGFPVITVSALAVFRHFKVGYAASLACSVLFAFLPSRLQKGEGHIFLDSFFQVPLAVMVLLWVCSDSPPLVGESSEGHWPRADLTSRRSVIALVICALVASTGPYYAFFTGCLVTLAGFWASLRKQTLRNVVAGTALAGALALGLGVNGLPTIIYRTQHGSNPLVAVRNASEAEFYGMKIVQLVLPADGHRIPALRRLKQKYNSSAPLLGENSSTALGATGTVGFLALLALALLGTRPRPQGNLWGPLAALNLGAVLLGTIGGFGSLLALLVYPQIRTYSRLNVFIGFFALFAVALLLDRLIRRRARLGMLAAGAVLLLGLFDQATALAVRPYAQVKAEYGSDERLVHRIENALPPGAMIFQLPYQTFPEGRPQHRMVDYDQLRPYLHSRSLRWSYPTMRGRPGDLWTGRMAQRTPTEMVRTLSDAGFAGILLDRYAYPEGNRDVETAIVDCVGSSAWVSDDQRLVFVSLADHARDVRPPPSPAPHPAQ